MLSYTLSLIVVMALLLAGMSYVLRRHFPFIYRIMYGIPMGMLRLSRRAFRALIKRLGWYRSLFGIYLFAAVILTLGILRSFGINVLENIGILTVIWLPPIAVWKVRKYFKDRRDRRYRLPGRRS